MLFEKTATCQQGRALQLDHVLVFLFHGLSMSCAHDYPWTGWLGLYIGFVPMLRSGRFIDWWVRVDINVGAMLHV